MHVLQYIPTIWSTDPTLSSEMTKQESRAMTEYCLRAQLNSVEVWRGEKRLKRGIGNSAQWIWRIGNSVTPSIKKKRSNNCIEWLTESTCEPWTHHIIRKHRRVWLCVPVRHAWSHITYWWLKKKLVCGVMCCSDFFSKYNIHRVGGVLLDSLYLADAFHVYVQRAVERYIQCIHFVCQQNERELPSCALIVWNAHDTSTHSNKHTSCAIHRVPGLHVFRSATSGACDCSRASEG